MRLSYDKPMKTAKTSHSFSLIFVNYQSARHLARSLESLFSLENSSEIEIIIVNNDETETLLLEKLQETFPFFLIKNEKNVGFGQGANKGAAIATGDILGFLNPDTLWQKSCLGIIAAAFHNKRRIGIAGMRLIGADKKTEPWSFGETPGLQKLLLNNLFPTKKFPDHKTSPILNVDWVSGGALFTRNNVFRSVHGFDEKFFLYFEDTDICLRTRQAGYDVCLIPQATLMHHGGQSSSSRKIQKNHFYTSQETYFKKHRPGWEYILLRIFRFFRYGF